MEKDGCKLKKQKDTSTKEREIGQLKLGEAPGIDEKTAEVLIYGEIFMDIIFRARQHGKWVVPNYWTLAVVAPIYKGKGSEELCKNYRSISLLKKGKGNNKEVELSKKQRVFFKGRSCVDQIFTVNQIAEKYIRKRKKMYAPFIDQVQDSDGGKSENGSGLGKKEGRREG